ncbi:MAG: hypothetical protein V3V14_01110 [Saprospiraceae bacterium]
MNTSEKIHKSIQEIAKLQAVKRHSDSVNEELDSVLDKKDEIENNLIKELEDITKLEKLGIRSIFHKVLGDKEKQLEIERQEYLQVTLQHKEILNALEVVEFEKSILDKKLVDLDELVNRLEALKKVRSQEILNSPNALRNELVLLFDKMDDVKKYQVELEQAQVAGKNVGKSINIVYGHLKKAKDWGAWDMTSKSRHYKMMKHGAIDRAMQEVSRTKLILRIFNKEINDIGYKSQRMALKIDSISKFPGIIFDNLISDWIVQNKIKGVLSTVENLADDINLVLKSIKNDFEKSKNELEKLDIQRNKLLEEN